MGKMRNMLKNINEKQNIDNFPSFCVKTTEYLLTAKSILKNFTLKFPTQWIDEKFLDALITQLNDTKTFKTDKKEYTKFYIRHPYKKKEILKFLHLICEK